MKNTILLLALIFVNQAVFGQSKEICITLDDLPAISYDFKDIEFQQDLVNKLIATFDEFDIPAIGFVNESKLYKNGTLDHEKVELLRTWLAAGYELGNHTYAHKDYHKVSQKAFFEDVIKGEEVCKDLVKDYDQQYIYFRHPFLHVGLDKKKHEELSIFLDKHDYIEAPVSIDNDDYIFAYAYSKALLKNDIKLMKQIGEDYIDYMEEKLLFFERQSQKILDRNVKHILLLHASRINADYLDELAKRYQKHGYSFISLEAALRDEAYQKEITKYNNWGISWIDRWALSAGKKGDFFKGDPVTPDYVKAFLK